MKNEFAEVMQTRTDADLIKILNSTRGDYQTDAMDAAKLEFDRRNLSEQQISTIKENIKQEDQVNEVKANEPLGSSWKALSFIFPGIIQIMFAGTFKRDGYDRKYKDLIKFTLYGYAFYIECIILLVIFE
jgi:hypothetical protein